WSLWIDRSSYPKYVPGQIYRSSVQSPRNLPLMTMTLFVVTRNMTIPQGHLPKKMTTAVSKSQ
ncbi:unnamed protein product, partial [Brassica oleracea var. botrytis]